VQRPVPVAPVAPLEKAAPYRQQGGAVRPVMQARSPKYWLDRDLAAEQTNHWMFQSVRLMGRRTWACGGRWVAGPVWRGVGLGLLLTVVSGLVVQGVAAAAPPPNDNFAAAEIVTGFPATVSGSNLDATREPGEPRHGGLPASHSVWWTWTPRSSGTVLIRACRGRGVSSTTLGVYLGTAVGSLTEVTSAFGGGFRGCPRGTRVAFYAIAGQQYRIAVDDGVGRVHLRLQGQPVDDDFAEGKVKAVLLDGRAFGTIVDVNGNDWTRHTRRNKLLRAKGRIAPPVLPGTPQRRYVCLDAHYRGELFGRDHPHRKECGWGTVSQYGHLHADQKHQADAVTSQQLALKSHSIPYATRQLNAARRHLNWVSNWMYGWGDDSFEEVDQAVYLLGQAKRLLYRAALAPTRTQRRHLQNKARTSRIKRALKMTRESLGGELLHVSG
jgi:hypothetical protein